MAEMGAELAASALFGAAQISKHVDLRGALVITLRVFRVESYV